MGRVPVTVALTDAQLGLIARQLSDGATVTDTVSELARHGAFQDSFEILLNDARYSHSLVRALLLLTAFPDDGGELSVKDLANRLGWSTSTTHKYVLTWTALGVLERTNKRHYRYATQQPQEPTAASHDSTPSANGATVRPCSG
jgi:hypothetical protein